MIIAKIEGMDKIIRSLQQKGQAVKNQKKSVVVGYTAAYAIYVHEKIEMKLKGQPRSGGRGMYWDPQGQAQAKFLETPARTMRGQLAKIAGDVVRRTGDLGQGLFVAGLALQRASQLMVPVDTGNLKNSAYTRYED